MRAFFARYLPPAERSTALWLALGGTGVMWAVTEFGYQIMDRLPIWEPDSTMSLGSAFALQAAAQFGAVALLVALLIRVARAPRVLGLFIALAALAAGVLELVNLVGTPLSEMAGIASATAGTALGAVVGAWIASTVTLARVTDAGFSGDDSETGDGLKRKPASRGFGFIGWEGRPLAGAPLIAVAFVAVTILPALATAALNMAVSLLPLEAEPGFVGEMAFTYGGPLVVFTAWFFSAMIVSKRSGVASLWIGALGSVLYYLVVGLWFAVPLLGESVADGVREIGAALSALGVPVSALLGTALAFRSKARAASASHAQDSDA